MHIQFHSKALTPLRSRFRICVEYIQKKYGDLPSTLDIYGTTSCRRYGSCRVYPEENRAVIRLHVSLVDNPDMADNTILHELLHARYACWNCAHGEPWKQSAKEVSEDFPLRYPIQRTSSYMTLPDKRPTLYVRCSRCHYQFATKSKSMQTKYVRYYRCAHCNGRLKAVPASP